MLRRLHRAIGGLALLMSVGFIIGITIIPRIHHQDLLQQPSDTPYWPSDTHDSAANDSLSSSSPQLLEEPALSPLTTQEERFLSYSPHGDYLEQHEALRMAVRLAYETNRTVKAPPLRLAYGNSTWIHVPWSKLFDFSPIEQTFGIRILDRPVAPATAPAQPGEAPPPPTIEYEQAEYYERVEITHNSRQRNTQQQKPKNENSWFFIQWFQKGSAAKDQERKLVDVVADSSLPAPPKRIYTLSDLKQLESPYVHCNALGSWMFRKSLEVKDQQQILNVAMTSTMLVRPDQLFPMTAAADTVVHALGGAGEFSGLTIHLNRMVPQEESDKWLYADDDGGDQLEGENSTTTMEARAATARALMNRRRMDAMRDAAMELFSSMPIDQAVSAAMPVQASTLRDYLDEHQEQLKNQGSSSSSEEVPLLDRRRLLDMCKDYRRHVDERFPIVYMMVHDEDESDNSGTTTADPLLREKQADIAKILKPILDYFPCVFYRKDFYQWGMIDASWAIESQLELAAKEVLDGNTLMSTQMVDFEQLLSPLLDLLIAGQGYSFFEIPPSPLTRAVAWQLTGVDK